MKHIDPVPMQDTERTCSHVIVLQCRMEVNASRHQLGIRPVRCDAPISHQDHLVCEQDMGRVSWTAPRRKCAAYGYRVALTRHEQ